MIKIEDGKITQTSLPQHGYIDGRFVSTMANVPKEDLYRNGWYDAEHRKPEYDAAYEKLSQPKYTYNKKEDKVFADYTVIEKPEAVLKRRVDTLEKEMQPQVLSVREDIDRTRAELVQKELIEDDKEVSR